MDNRKTCSICLDNLSIDKFRKFYNKKYNKFYYKTFCIDCENKNQLKKYHINSVEINEKLRLKYNVKDNRVKKLKYRYNLKEEEVINLLIEQNYNCPVSNINISENFNIDHIKGTKIVRGLLHPNINKGLGFFEHDIGLLNQAIDYLTDNVRIEKIKKIIISNKDKYNLVDSNWDKYKKQKNTQLKKNYGISLWDWYDILKFQNNKCLISKNYINDNLNDCLALDHFEINKLKIIRGIIFNNYNAGLGFFDHNPLLIKNAIEYLIKSSNKINDTNYPFNELRYLNELKEYILDCNINGHYKKGKSGVHTFDLIARGQYNRGLHFCISNIIKYGDRIGYKEGFNRKDLFKIAHYLILALYCLDECQDERAPSFKKNKINEDIIDRNIIEIKETIINNENK